MTVVCFRANVAIHNSILNSITDLFISQCYITSEMRDISRVFLSKKPLSWKCINSKWKTGYRYLYEQGQSPEPRIREYFYYIDHQGMLFMDDARIKNFTSCFKEVKFLVFFFNRLRVNDTGRYEKEFPYFSPCGRERNYIRCDDVPYVYTHVIPDSKEENQFRFCYGHAKDELHVKFEPEKTIMLPKTGRVYHPAPEKVGGIGLVKSSLAIEFSKFFTFGNSEDNPPTHFTWNGKTYELVKWYDSLPSDESDENSTDGKS